MFAKLITLASDSDNFIYPHEAVESTESGTYSEIEQMQEKEQ